MSSKDPRPEIMRLEEVALLVKGGDIKLPRFQRPFVWKRPDMLKLLDSIYKGYPIGSILIWNSSQRLSSERSIAGLEVDDQRLEWLPTNYLLDGQQRLTTLCGALFWTGNENSSIWNIHFDLEKQSFVHPKDSDSSNLFPLNRLINTGDFIRQCMKFEPHPKRTEYVQTAEKLLRVIKDYKIAVVKIGDMTLQEVAPIFERINSTGRKLTMVDLMMAATWSNGFDLNHEIKSIKEECENLGFTEVSEQMVLRSIAAAAGLGINKDDIQKLRNQEPSSLLSATHSTKDGLLSALRFLKEEIGLDDISYIPYGLQLTYLGEIFRISPSPNTSQIEEMKKWFWFTSITRYFGTSNSGQNSKDLTRIRSFSAGEQSTLFDRKEIDISRLLFDRFNLRNATSTTFALLLIRSRPTLTFDNRSLDNLYLTYKSNRYFKSMLEGSTMDLNISFVLHPLSGGFNFGSLNHSELIDHLLTDPIVKASTVNDIEEFINQRSLLVAAVTKDLTSCPVAAVKFDESIDVGTDAEVLTDQDNEF